ncbi:unnamed protein product [Anisakis simplex]|uniref:Proton-coupled folate transporter n=1 Tax=Anisakis simplex TaxID=6269 RepID=A0A0M3JV51_ANISI|nr:unnamed protein product [Anisakis simplex]
MAIFGDSLRFDVCRCSEINVEPVIFLFSITFALILTVQPLFLYWARCIELFQDSKNFTDGNETFHNVSELCAQLSQPNNSYYQDIVEKDIASTKILLQIASGIPTLITAPIIGAWSDGSGGRRRPLLIGLFGLLLYSLLQFASTIFYKSVNVYTIQYLAELTIGFSGGIATIFTASFAIVTDDSRHQMAPGTNKIPLRIAIASALQSLGLVAGNMIASVFSISPAVSIQLHEIGYVKSTAISFTVVLVAILYTLLFVRETYQNQFIPVQEIMNTYNDKCLNASGTGSLSIRRPTLHLSDASTPTTTGSPRRNYWKSFKLFFYDLVEVVAAPRHGWARFCLNLSICFTFVEFLAIGIMSSLIKRLQNISNVSAKAEIQLIIKMLWNNTMKYNSCLIVRFILISAGSFSCFAGAIAPGYRSFLPRFVAKEETARLFAIFGIVMVFCPILSAFVFNNIFNATIDMWPGFAYLVGALFQLIVFVGQIIIHRLMMPQWREERNELNGAEQESLLRNEDDEDDEPDGPESQRRNLVDPNSADVGSVMNRSLSNTAIHSSNASPGASSNDTGSPLLTQDCDQQQINQTI